MVERHYLINNIDWLRVKVKQVPDFESRLAMVSHHIPDMDSRSNQQERLTYRYQDTEPMST